MMRFILIALVFLTSCKSREDQSEAMSAADSTALSVRSPLTDGSLQPTWTYEQLKEFIQNHDLMSVDELVEGLAAADNGSDLLDQALLVYAGTGDQHSSKDAPRAILFTPDASLIVSYAGETYANEDENLEVIQFRYDRQRFEFFEIVFSEENGVQFFDGSQAETPEPDHCASCHTEDPRPIWEAAPLWPGVYGGIGDKISAHTLEYEAAGEFLTAAATLPRYAHLSTIKAWQGGGIEKAKMANAFFGQQIAKLNFRRMARLLRETPGHDAFKYALLSVLVGCEEDVPGKAIPSDQQFLRSYADVLADTRTMIEDYYLDKVANFEALDESINTDASPTFRPVESPDELRVIAGLRYLLEERASNPMAMAHWSTTFSQSYAFAAPGLGIRDFAGYYFVHAFEEDTKMGGMHQDIVGQGDHLVEPSAEAFASRIKTNRPETCRLLLD